MKHVRLALSGLVVLLLLAGYAASVVAYPEGAADHAARMDSPAVRVGAVILCLAALALALVPEREETPEP